MIDDLTENKDNSIITPSYTYIYVYTTHIHRHLDVHKQNNKKKVVKISRANDRLLGKNTKKKLKYLR